MPLNSVNGLSSLSSGATLTIQPPSDEEWIIHNIYYGNDLEIEITDGANSVSFHTESGSGSLSRFSFHLTNSHYLILTNNSGSSAVYGYDGVQSV